MLLLLLMLMLMMVMVSMATGAVQYGTEDAEQVKCPH